jgi:hypothetical protein
MKFIGRDDQLFGVNDGAGGVRLDCVAEGVLCFAAHGGGFVYVHSGDAAVAAVAQAAKAAGTLEEFNAALFDIGGVPYIGEFREEAAS